VVAGIIALVAAIKIVVPTTVVMVHRGVEGGRSAKHLLLLR
jgi:hypothetical protein